MTYRLETKNHGFIEAGYCGFLDKVRFNDSRAQFTLHTPTFVGFVADLARGKNEWDLKIVEDKTTWARTEYNPQSGNVSLGYCNIAVEEFGRFADYVFQGGFLGWDPVHPSEWRPDFVMEAREKVQKYLLRRKKESDYLSRAQQKELPRLEDLLREKQ